jgi:hypothetical protein
VCSAVGGAAGKRIDPRRPDRQHADNPRKVSDCVGFSRSVKASSSL